MTVYFDYDRELRSLSATVAYRGMGYKHGVGYSEVKPVVCDDIVKQYAENVCSQIDNL